MNATKTGGFTIGFRRMGWKWSQDLEALIQWSKKTGFGAIDIGRNGIQIGQEIVFFEQGHAVDFSTSDFCASLPSATCFGSKCK